VETIGNPHVDVAVIECNGEIEMDDNFRITYDRFTRLGYDIFHHPLNDLLVDPKFNMRRMGNAGLSAVCQKCELATVCGGGSLPHRYSKARLFDNPSVYCYDLKKLIFHIRDKVFLN
jgi:uncharacterized protein